METKNRVGVLAVQGDFDAHTKILESLGIQSAAVKAPCDLDALNGLILPGGESSAHLRILKENGLFDEIRAFHGRGGSLYGTCAGLILLARNVTQPSQESLGLIDVDVVRNGYGRQIDSFEADVTPETPDLKAGPPMHMVFIRAPRISRLGPAVRVLLTLESEPVAARQGRVLVSTFHPEMAGDSRLHRYFLERVIGSPPV